MLLLGVLALSAPAHAQRIEMPNAAEIQMGLQKLNVLGSVLYIAAHPDDENTAALAYFSKGKKLRTAYLSLTRGDGGQNLIGPEKGAEIGIIRTQELLAARGIDGGEQYFTRAIDYGYSKTLEETLSFWGKEAVLGDIVWVIRTFRPDVIITRFPIDRPSGHGHHSASGLLARRLSRRPRILKNFPNNWITSNRGRRRDCSGTAGGPVSRRRRKRSRSMSVSSILSSGPRTRRSPPAAVPCTRVRDSALQDGEGPAYDYFQLIDGSPLGKDLLEGIDTSWARVPGDTIGMKLKEVAEDFNPQDPTRSLPKLLDAYSEMKSLEPMGWSRSRKRKY